MAYSIKKIYLRKTAVFFSLQSFLERCGELEGTHVDSLFLLRLHLHINTIVMVTTLSSKPEPLLFKTKGSNTESLYPSQEEKMVHTAILHGPVLFDH